MVVVMMLMDVTYFLENNDLRFYSNINRMNRTVG